MATVKYRALAHEAVTLWSASRIDLMEGKADNSIPMEKDKAILNAFVELDNFSDQMIEAVDALLDPDSETPRVLDTDTGLELLELAKVSSEYLDRMDTITKDYQKISDERISNLVRVEIFVLCFTLIVLVIEIFFVVIPSVRHAFDTYHIHKKKKWAAWSSTAL